MVECRCLPMIHQHKCDEDNIFSLLVTVVLVPLVLYKIHMATTRLVMEGDNLRHWFLINK